MASDYAKTVEALDKVEQLYDARESGELLCPFCHTRVQRQKARACSSCGAQFGDSGLGEFYQGDEFYGMVSGVLNDYKGEIDYSILANGAKKAVKEEEAHSGDMISFMNEIQNVKNDHLKKIEEGGQGAEFSKFRLALGGIDHRQYDFEEMVSCEVCEKDFLNTQTQQHHISYLHDFTVTVCYSCHRKIHHKEGFYDELQPDISREEAKKLRKTGYLDEEED